MVKFNFEYLCELLEDRGPDVAMGYYGACYSSGTEVDTLSTLRERYDVLTKLCDNYKVRMPTPAAGIGQFNRTLTLSESIDAMIEHTCMAVHGLKNIDGPPPSALCELIPVG